MNLGDQESQIDCQINQPFLRLSLSNQAGQKSPRLFLGVVAVVILGLTGCASLSKEDGDKAVSPLTAETSTDGERLKIVTTFLPITLFTQAVAGDRAEVIQLLPLNVSPHDYQAKPEDVQRLTQADLLVKNGLGTETFLDDLLKTAQNSELQEIDTSRGIPTLGEETDSDSNKKESNHQESHHQEHDHQEHDHQASTSEPSANPAPNDSHHSHHSDVNPHIWLDPQRAIQQVETIRDGLVAADPQGKAQYSANAAAYIQKLQNLDQDIASTLKPYAGKTFVAYHDFAPYFAQRYGLRVEFLVDVPEENPSPQDVQRVLKIAQKSNLKALLTEPQLGEKVFSALAKDLDVSVSVFDPMETGDTDSSQPDYYFTVMSRNAANLTKALKGVK